MFSRLGKFRLLILAAIVTSLTSVGILRLNKNTKEVGFPVRTDRVVALPFAFAGLEPVKSYRNDVVNRQDCAKTPKDLGLIRSATATVLSFFHIKSVKAATCIPGACA